TTPLWKPASTNGEPHVVGAEGLFDRTPRMKGTLATEMSGKPPPPWFSPSPPATMRGLPESPSAATGPFGNARWITRPGIRWSPLVEFRLHAFEVPEPWQDQLWSQS